MPIPRRTANPRAAAHPFAHAAALLLALAAALLLSATRARGGDPAPAGLTIESVEAVDGVLVAAVANRGSAPSAGAELVVATRAAGRLVGSARRRLEPLAPGAVREERVSLAVWGSQRPDLRAGLERQGCCTTRVWLEPGAAPPLEVRHGIGPAAPAPAHAAPSESEASEGGNP